VGRDPQLAEAIFPDRSVSRLHARIEETAPGAFWIFDEGSTSGTWVNFSPVAAAAGQELKHGDLINLGRVQLRFKTRLAPKTGGNGAAGAGPLPERS
jgi:predicted component of type VI protein secretion system